jgi:hypothetical protein
VAGILDTPSKPRASFFAASGLVILGMGLFDALTSVFAVTLDCERAAEVRCVIERASATSSMRVEVAGVKLARLETRQGEHHQVELAASDRVVSVVEGFRLGKADAERLQKAVEGLISGQSQRAHERVEAPQSRRLGGIGFAVFFAGCFASAAWIVRPRAVG